MTWASPSWFPTCRGCWRRSSATDPTSTGPDGAVDITPAPGFVGTVTFAVAPRAGSDTVTITVEVVPEPAPVAVDDRIEVARGDTTARGRSAEVHRPSVPHDHPR
jgi:hypothetical protein